MTTIVTVTHSSPNNEYGINIVSIATEDEKGIDSRDLYPGQSAEFYVFDGQKLVITEFSTKPVSPEPASDPVVEAVHENNQTQEEPVGGYQEAATTDATATSEVENPATIVTSENIEVVPDPAFTDKSTDQVVAESQPPVDNDHVADGAEQFSQETIDTNVISASPISDTPENLQAPPVSIAIDATAGQSVTVTETIVDNQSSE